MKLKQNELAHVHTTFTVTKAKDLPDGQFEAILSTEDLDRHGEIVSIKGIQVPEGQVMKMYYNHETTGENLPIGQWTKIWKSSDGKLKGRGQIDMLDDFEVKIAKKIKLGTLDSISIGFYPLEFDGNTSTWTKSTLVEASVVAEPANVNARVTQKALGFTDEEFEQSFKAKLAEVKEEKITVKVLRKGLVEDVLTMPDKWELMDPFYDIICAFQDAYYAEDTPATDFNKLLSETIALLQRVVDGTYDLTDENDSDESSANGTTEVKTAIEDLKSKLGAVEDATEAAAEIPAIKTLIKVRMAAKEVGKAADDLNKVIRIKLKESHNE